jgi:hypothetical protein
MFFKILIQDYLITLDPRRNSILKALKSSLRFKVKQTELLGWEKK